MKTPAPALYPQPLRKRFLQNMEKTYAEHGQNPRTAMGGAVHCIRLERQNG